MSTTTERVSGRDTPPCRHIEHAVTAELDGPARGVIAREDVATRMRLYDAQHPFALRPFHAFDNGICPPRLAVNVYRQGCAFKCQFCYVWLDRRVRPDRGVLRHLPTEILLAKQLGLGGLPVMVSCSTDPFQPLETTHRHTEKVLDILSAAGFPLIVLTQNPAGLLDGSYVELLARTSSVVEVSIASPAVGATMGIFFSLAPSAPKRLRAIAELTQRGVHVRLRLDPIIPRVGPDGPGQSAEDIRQLVHAAAAAGIRMVVSKTMVLTPEIPAPVRRLLLPFYESHRANGSNDAVMVLDAATQRVLLSPVRTACADARVAFCSCVSPVSFQGAVACRFPV